MPTEAKSWPTIEPGKPLPREYWPDESHIVTEDDTPVDNAYSVLLMHLLADAIHTSWRPPDGSQRFLALGNVGVFSSPDMPPLVPDFFLSTDVDRPTSETIWQKHGRSYFIWRHGKPPDIVIEFVSNREGDELTRKRDAYARMGVRYYIVWDPYLQLSDDKLTVLELKGLRYHPTRETWFADIGIGVAPWTGTHEKVEDEWLRWCDAQGHVLPTGAERAEEQKQRADFEKARADQQLVKAEQEKARADQLAAEVERLRSLLQAKNDETKRP